MTDINKTVGQLERLTQNRIVDLFKGMGYAYLGNWEDREDNSNIEEELLKKYLSDNGYTDNIIDRSLYELKQASENQSKGLYFVNKDVYELLRYGVKVKEDVSDKKQNVWLIDWENPEKNHFAIAEEVTVKGQHDKRPDIVLYVNGIAIGVLELKRSTISVSEGIRQNLDNQLEHFIRQFFSTVQLVMAGNDTEGLRYGVIETSDKYYLTWKEDSDIQNPLDRQITQLCEKNRLLELVHDFIVYDKGIKKICRPNQYFGVKAAQESVKKRQGGIIWHTQGSGKSLTMVWLTKWIYENNPNARVLLITDRDELDKQIEKVYKGVKEDIYRTKSGRDLIEKLNSTTPWLLCSLIHKFGTREQPGDEDYETFIEELKNNLPADFRPKGDIFVFVDECHRTQSGKLHEAMKQILGNAVFIGFTGTPLLKKDKQTSLEIFGPYIHTYKFDEAVKDKVILDLRYEARDIPQDLTSQDKVDQWFEAKTRGLTDYAKIELKKRWGTMQKVLSSKSRLNIIVSDVLLDMETKDRLQSGQGNAMLVAGSIYQACRYYELFQDAGFKKCAIVTSYSPSTSDLRGTTTGEDLNAEELQEYEIYQKMLDGKDPEKFEDEVKKMFVDEPGQMKLLIVVDKLLTGFDAPSATYLYIDKSMQDHGLFQAICRVNRLDDESKTYGFIIDYKDLFKSLEKAVDEYTSEAFEGYDKDDVEGLLTNRLEKGKEDLEEALERVSALCEPVEQPKDTYAYTKYFCGDPEKVEDLQNTAEKRVALYKHVSSLVRAYANLANEMQDAGFSQKEAQDIKDEVKHYESVRQEIKLISGDYIDLKTFEPSMRHLIDTYIDAQESKKISGFDDLTIVDLLVKKGAGAIEDLPEGIKKNKNAIAETIENNVRKVIIDEKPTNPKYFEKMSVLLDELIRERKEKARAYEEYLARIIELAKRVSDPGTDSAYPSTMRTSAQRALYDNLGQDEPRALRLHDAIMHTKRDDWQGNIFKIREMKKAIRQHVDDNDLETIYDLIKNQKEYR